MTSATSIVGVRRARLSYIAAVCLILLTISPFTAPFSVCDEAELTGESISLDKQPYSKIADDTPCASVLSAVSLTPLLLVALVHPEITTPALERSRFLIVLRI